MTGNQVHKQAGRQAASKTERQRDRATDGETLAAPTLKHTIAAKMFTNNSLRKISSDAIFSHVLLDIASKTNSLACFLAKMDTPTHDKTVADRTSLAINFQNDYRPCDPRWPGTSV